MALGTGPQNAAKPTTSFLTGAVYNATPPTVGSGQQCALQCDVNGKLIVSATFSGTISGNAAAGPTGSLVPASADYIGFNVGGNLVGVSAGNPLPITGSISASNPSVGPTGSPVPADATAIGVQDGSGNLQIASSANPVRIDPTGTTIQPVNGTVVVKGNVASGSAVSGANPPVLVAGQDGTNVRTLLSSSTGQLHVIVDSGGGGGTQYTDGTAESVGAFTITVAGSYNGTDVVGLRSDASNNLYVNLNTAVPAGANLIGLIKISDGTNSMGTMTNFGSTPGAVKALNANVSLFQGTTVVGSGAPLQVTLANTSANSTPVTVSSLVTDTAPSTQNVTARDTNSTTTAVANGANFITGSPTAGSVASFALASGFDTAQVQITGTWTGTLTSEVSMDGGTTWVSSGLQQQGAPWLSSSWTANVIGSHNTAGYTNIRLRATAAWTGTATVAVVQSLNSRNVYVTNALKIQDPTTQSNIATVKGASTAAVGADPALVVTLSPNNAIVFPASPVVWIEGHAGGVFDAATGAAVPANAIMVGGTDGTDLRAFSVNSSGQQVVVGAGTAGSGSGGVLSIQGVASGVTVPITGTITAVTTITNPVTVVGDAASGSAVAGNPVLVAGQDGTDARTLLTSNTGQLHVVADTGSTTAVTQATAANLNATVVPGGSAIFEVSPTTAANTVSNTFFTQIGDGTHAATLNSTTYTAKYGLDVNLLGTLGTAFTTAGFVDIKGADGNVFVRQATAANLNATVVPGGSAVFEVSPTTAANTKTNPFFSAITDGTNVITAAISAWGTAPTGTEVQGVNALVLAGTAGGPTPKGYHVSSNAVQAIKSSAGQLYGYFLDNTANTLTSYYQFFNVASGSVTLGSTASLFVIPVPGGSAANLSMNPGWAFSTAMSFAVTTTYNGSTFPANAVDATVTYL